MSLSVNSRMVAEVRLEHVALRPLVGAYELLFMLQGMTVAVQSTPYWLVFNGVQVSVTPSSGQKFALGTARADVPVRIQQCENQLRVGAELKLVLQPHQVMAMEDCRNAGNLRFELTILGEGGDGIHRWSTYDTLAKEVPRSDWIIQLRSARALDILLIEVAMPVTDVPPERQKMAGHLKQAEKMFLEGHYSECVAACRHVIEAVDTIPSMKQQWTEALKKLGTRELRESMSKEEREFALLAAALSYTQPAHHPDATATAYFTRTEAKLALSVCASLLAYAVNGALSPVR